jgi:hypothetical protein
MIFFLVSEFNYYMHVDINLDWEQIIAVDILMILQSFTPSTDSIVSVTIYILPSLVSKEWLKRRSLAPLEYGRRNMSRLK